MPDKRIVVKMLLLLEEIAKIETYLMTHSHTHHTDTGRQFNVQFWPFSTIFATFSQKNQQYQKTLWSH